MHTHAHVRGSLSGTEQDRAVHVRVHARLSFRDHAGDCAGRHIIIRARVIVTRDSLTRPRVILRRAVPYRGIR